MSHQKYWNILQKEKKKGILMYNYTDDVQYIWHKGHNQTINPETHD